MKKPTEYNLVEIDLWRQYIEMKILRRSLLGVESYGWNGYEIELNERGLN